MTAQSDIQSFFNTALTKGVENAQAGNVTTGDGNSIDFWGWSLVLEGGRGWVAVEGDGTVFSWRKDIGRVMGNEGWGGKGIGEQEGAIL